MKGNIYNRMQEGGQFEELHIGMGATKMYYSDREPYTVQKIISDKRVIVTADKYTRVDDRYCSDWQTYEYESTPLHEEMVTGCTDYVGHILGAEKCPHNENGCEACPFFKEHLRTNGIELRLCKKGWKEVGRDQYYALGIREAYYDYSF